jgi:hypothetical protein
MEESSEVKAGSFELKKVLAGRAFYTRVRLEVEEIWLPQVEIDFRGFSEWDKAISFAAHYFFDHHQGSGKKRGLRITILEFHTMPPDTNNMVAFYAVVRALYNAFNRDCNLTINESGDFVVPK